MAKKLRFTGEWPPQQYWSQFPNWENALDEEDEPAQDETTLRPAEEQTYIAEYTSFTTGNATLADGRTAPALIEVLGGTPAAVVIFLKEGEVRVTEDVENQ